MSYHTINISSIKFVTSKLFKLFEWESEFSLHFTFFFSWCWLLAASAVLLSLLIFLFNKEKSFAAVPVCLQGMKAFPDDLRSPLH